MSLTNKKYLFHWMLESLCKGIFGHWIQRDQEKKKAQFSAQMFDFFRITTS